MVNNSMVQVLIYTSLKHSKSESHPQYIYKKEIKGKKITQHIVFTLYVSPKVKYDMISC